MLGEYIKVKGEAFSEVPARVIGECRHYWIVDVCGKYKKCISKGEKLEPISITTLAVLLAEMERKGL
jgi:hypothetical protein